jgi:hypothetical protein
MDFYASCLLMPRKLVFAAWDEMFPDRKQRVIQPRTPIAHRYIEVPRLEGLLDDSECTKSDDLVLERFAKPFAKKFPVSPVAMRIRLEKIGLLHRVVLGQRLLEKLDQLAAGTEILAAQQRRSKRATSISPASCVVLAMSL